MNENEARRGNREAWELERLWEQLAEWEEYTIEIGELGDVPDTREVR
jgi:hypothetical protein